MSTTCFLTVLFLGLCFFTHFIVGFFGFALVGFWILGFWRVIRIKRLFLAFVRIFIPAILITSPMWLPILAFRTPKSEPGVSSLNWENIKAISWSWLLNFNLAQKISPYDVIKLTPFLYPLAAFLNSLTASAKPLKSSGIFLPPKSKITTPAIINNSVVPS